MTTTALEKVIDITPPVLYFPDDWCVVSLAALEDSLYLATCQVSNDKKTIIGTVYRYDDESKLWQNLAQRIFSVKSDLVSSKPLQCKIFALHAGKETCVLTWFFGPFNSQVLISLSEQSFRDISVPSVNKGLIIQQLLYGEGYIYAFLTYPEKSSDFGQAEIIRLPIPFREVLSQWEALPSPLQPHKAHQAISKLAFWDHKIYASISDSVSGFEIWCLEPDINEWHQILINGLERYSLNAQVSSVIVFNKNLYLTTGLDVGNRYLDTFELACIYPNYDWDLIVGTPRFTSIGIRVPLLSRALRPKASQLAQLITHEDTLYLGCQSIEGLKLWSSTDGINWDQLAILYLSQYLYVHLLEIVSSSKGLLLICKTQNVAGVSQRRLILYQK